MVCRPSMRTPGQPTAMPHGDMPITIWQFASVAKIEDFTVTHELDK